MLWMSITLWTIASRNCPPAALGCCDLVHVAIPASGVQESSRAFSLLVSAPFLSHAHTLPYLTLLVLREADVEARGMYVGLVRVSNLGPDDPLLDLSRLTLQYYFNGAEGVPDTTDPLSQYDMECLDTTIGEIHHFLLCLCSPPYPPLRTLVSI